MEPNLLMHTAARRHLIDRRGGWIDAYSGLPNAGREPDGYHYLDDAKNIYPRYNVLDAIRVEVERLDPENLPEASALATELIRAGMEGASMFTTGHADDIQQLAMDDERRRFVAWVEQVADGGCGQVDPLPYRRTLGREERTDWWTRIEGRWSMEHGGWWEPIVSEAASDQVLALDDGPFWSDGGAGPATIATRSALSFLGIERVIELREYGPESEVAVEWLMPTYNGAEGFFTAGVADWLIFASHESVTALGGTIVPPFRKAWPDWRSARWRR